MASAEQDNEIQSVPVTTVATGAALRFHHQKALDIIRHQFPSFIAAVLSMGHVEWTTNIPTAAVASRGDGASSGRFRFIANPHFALSQSVDAWAGVIAHETMHIVLHHLVMMEAVADKKRFNIAADCVINDYLIGQSVSLPDGLCRGQDLVGYDCTHRSVRDVYRALEGNPVCESGEGQFDCHEMWDKMSDEDKSALKEAIDKAVQGAVDRGETVPSEAFKQANATKASTGARGLTRGLSAERRFAKNSDTSLVWARILRHIDPAIIRDTRGREPERPRSFYRDSYSLMGMQSSARLPVRFTPNEDQQKGQQKHQIALALDTSGSVTDEQQSMFLSLAQSLPRDLVDVYALEFNDVANRIDLDDPHLTSGGTEFSVIHEHIQEAVSCGALRAYPKAIIVISDGGAEFSHTKPSEREGRAWHWLLDGPAQSALKQFERANCGTAHRLQRFVGRAA